MVMKSMKGEQSEAFGDFTKTAENADCQPLWTYLYYSWRVQQGLSDTTSANMLQELSDIFSHELRRAIRSCSRSYPFMSDEEVLRRLLSRLVELRKNFGVRLRALTDYELITFSLNGRGLKLPSGVSVNRANLRALVMGGDDAGGTTSRPSFDNCLIAVANKVGSADADSVAKIGDKYLNVILNDLLTRYASPERDSDASDEHAHGLLDLFLLDMAKRSALQHLAHTQTLDLQPLQHGEDGGLSEAAAACGHPKAEASLRVGSGSFCSDAVDDFEEASTQKPETHVEEDCSRGIGCRLDVRITSARNMPRVDLLTGADVFCAAFVEGVPDAKVYQTEIRRGTSEAQWRFDEGQPFQWSWEVVGPVTGPAAAVGGRTLVIMVYDKDQLSSDDVVGCAVLPLSHLLAGGDFAGWHELTCPQQQGIGKALFELLTGGGAKRKPEIEISATLRLTTDS